MARRILDCIKCGAPMDKKATECTYCGAHYEELDPEPAVVSRGGSDRDKERMERHERRELIIDFLKEKSALTDPGCLSMTLMLAVPAVALAVSWVLLDWGWLGITGLTVGVGVVSFFTWIFVETARGRKIFDSGLRTEIIAFMKKHDVSFEELLLQARRKLSTGDTLRECLEDRKRFPRDILEQS